MGCGTACKDSRLSSPARGFPTGRQTTETWHHDWLVTIWKHVAIVLYSLLIARAPRACVKGGAYT